MSGTQLILRLLKQEADFQLKAFTRRYGQLCIDVLEFPKKVVSLPFTLAYDIAGSAPRGFGIPEFISKLSYSAIFVIIPFSYFILLVSLRGILSFDYFLLPIIAGKLFFLWNFVIYYRNYFNCFASLS